MTDKPHMTLPNGDKLFEGDYGRTRRGRKVGPMRYDGSCDISQAWDVRGSKFRDIARQFWSPAGKADEDTDLDIIAKWAEAPARPETGTLAELNVKPGDVVECIDFGVTPDQLTVGSFYPVYSGPVIITDKARKWGDGPDANTCFPEFAKFRIVSRASDAPKPEAFRVWRDMTPEEKGALLLAQHEGKVIEIRDPDHGELCVEGSEFGFLWNAKLAYRIRPEPKRETVTLYGVGYEWGQASKPYPEDTHRITFDLIDGKPDPATIRMEAINA